MRRPALDFYRRPLVISLAFGLTLLMVTAALGLLTVRTLRLERQEAQRAANERLEGRIDKALWEMDRWLAAHLTPELARPHFVYQPFFSVLHAMGRSSLQIPSPLLNQPNEFVRLHFQINDSGVMVSPQAPGIDQRALWLQSGGRKEAIHDNLARLAELRKRVEFHSILALLPRDTLPALKVASNQSVAAEASGLLSQLPGYNPQAELAMKNSDLAATDLRQGKASKQQEELNRELASRGEFFSQSTINQVAQQRLSFSDSLVAGQIAEAGEGVSRPLWIGKDLILARRVVVDEQTLVQGCWLDWPTLCEHLETLVGDLPGVELRPVAANEIVNPGRILAGLPVQLSVAGASPTISWRSPIRVALLAAWVGLLLGALAVSLLLCGVLLLSERRAEFVSAVTHELRSPLTTFRMYTEMLASGMVTDETQQHRYFVTLQCEAERLSHLVENVLSYARLERDGAPRTQETPTLRELLDRVRPRLQQRAEQAGMALSITPEPADVSHETVQTDVTVVDQILYNLVDNACKYAGKSEDKSIRIEATVVSANLRLRVSDHGPGIPADVRRRLFRPFSKSAENAVGQAPGVGLGLALCRRLAHQIGAKLTYERLTEQRGTSFVLSLPLARPLDSDA